ncbi:SpaA isopeptide-forming pilin-related protein [Enterococcus asini]|uniref:SpaA isopeptide-forming pilin-related protein n=1 Tax=Enterococcus asini TaxID=57732 RepID=UPI0022E688F6|nr:SpaA isopeptide-forming pilin-related protein [Enterococcus asini]
MMKVRKKLFTLSGLFMVLAQVFVAAFCGITAIAVTQEETTQSLYSNEYGSAAMSYEPLENDRIKWTLTLAKTGQQTATQFMVDLAVDGTSMVPENVTSEGISLIGASSNGHIQAGLSETATTMGGSGTVTFETARAIGTLTATPRLITSVEVPVETPVMAMAAEETTTTTEELAEAEPVISAPVDLLAGMTVGATFNIPAVEVVEEKVEEVAEVEEVIDPTLPGTAVGVDSLVVSGGVSKTEAVQEPSNSQNVGLPRDSRIAPVSSPYTSLRFEKTWAENYDNIPEDHKTIQLQIMQKEKREADSLYIEYGDPIPFKYPKAEIEWHNLPAGYDYTVVELENDNWGITKSEVEESAINSLTQTQSNSSTQWQGKNPSYFIAHKNSDWLIWTADHMETDADRLAFAASIQEFGKNMNGQPIKDFKDLGTEDLLDPNKVVWAEGSIPSGILGLKITVTATDTDFIVDASFDDKSGWTHFMYGGNSARRVEVTNQYISSEDITLKKTWDDEGNKYGTRKAIQLVLQQKLATAPDTAWKDYKNASGEGLLDIPEGSTEDSISSNPIAVPSKVKVVENEGTDTEVITYEDAVYRVVEKVKVGDNDYSGTRVPGYSGPDYSTPRILPVGEGGTLGVTNELLYADFSFTKFAGDGETPLSGVTFTLTGTGYSDKAVSAAETGLVSFTDLPVGTYTLAEIETVDGYQIPTDTWEVAVTDVEGELVVNSPFKDDKLVNELKPFDFTVFKEDELERALEGATFKLEKKDDASFLTQTLPNDQDNAPRSEFLFTNLTPGTYILTETKAPEGYTGLSGPVEIVIEDDGTVTIGGENVTPSPLTPGDTNNAFSYTAVNELKPFDFTVLKEDELGNALEGAEFTLTGPAGFETQVLPGEGKDPISTFEFKDLTPGTYLLTETEVPDGYTGLSGSVEIVIEDDGTVTIGGENVTPSPLTPGDTNNTFSYTVVNELKPFKFTVFKEDELGNALVGAIFTLEGPDEYEQVLPGEGKDPISTFEFDGLAPGIYTLTETKAPDGYIGMSGSVKIEIKNDGTVKINEGTVQVNAESEHNTFSYTVINKKKVPLPATGGSGTMMFVTIGVLALTATGLYFLKRKDQEVA